jgi:hypothetical protein
MRCTGSEIAPEKLSEKEHTGWMESGKNAGLVVGARSDYHKKHPCLVLWDELDNGTAVRANRKQNNKSILPDNLSLDRG